MAVAPLGVVFCVDFGVITSAGEERLRGEDLVDKLTLLLSSLLRSVTEWKASRWNRFIRFPDSILDAKSQLFRERSVAAGDLSNPASVFSSRSSTLDSRSRDSDFGFVGDFRSGCFELRSDPWQPESNSKLFRWWRSVTWSRPSRLPLPVVGLKGQKLILRDLNVKHILLLLKTKLTSLGFSRVFSEALAPTYVRQINFVLFETAA